MPSKCTLVGERKLLVFEIHCFRQIFHVGRLPFVTRECVIVVEEPLGEICQAISYSSTM